MIDLTILAVFAERRSSDGRASPRAAYIATPPGLVRHFWVAEVNVAGREAVGEPLALSTWNGDGAVRLTRLDRHKQARREPIGVTVDAAGKVLRKLRRAGATALRRTLRAERRERGPRTGSLLANEDLHFQSAFAECPRALPVDLPEPLADGSSSA